MFTSGGNYTIKSPPTTAASGPAYIENETDEDECPLDTFNRLCACLLIFKNIKDTMGTCILDAGLNREDQRYYMELTKRYIKSLVTRLADDDDPEKSINKHIDFALEYLSRFPVLNKLRDYKIPKLSETFVEEATEYMEKWAIPCRCSDFTYMDILHFYINERRPFRPLRRMAAGTQTRTCGKCAEPMTLHYGCYNYECANFIIDLRPKRTCCQ